MTSDKVLDDDEFEQYSFQTPMKGEGCRFDTEHMRSLKRCKKAHTRYGQPRISSSSNPRHSKIATARASFRFVFAPPLRARLDAKRGLIRPVPGSRAAGGRGTPSADISRTRLYTAKKSAW
jgi:hypothetical protein